MRFELFDFQKRAVSELIGKMASMQRSYDADGSLSAVSLTAPTAAGKTVISAAVAEGLFCGNEMYDGDDRAVILWLSDSPSLNEQTMKKFDRATDILSGVASMEAIGPEFAKNHRKLQPGHVYFLNRQLLGKGKRLSGEAEGGRSFYDVLTDTIEDSSIHLYLFIDEAHRGIGKGADKGTSDKDNRTIYSIIIDGQEGVNPPMPCVIGISATPERFDNAMKGRKNRDMKAGVTVTPAEVRESGLIKDIIELSAPEDKTDDGDSEDYDLSVSCERLSQSTKEWEDYCTQNGICPAVIPLMVVQVEDRVSRESLSSLCRKIRENATFLDTSCCFANVFGEHEDIETDDGFLIPYVQPDEVSERTDIRVLFAKDAVSTGWDCPRAEVIYSRRRRSDPTYVAQMVGRMVRTPLARRVDGMESLNTVACYLPKYDSATVDAVVDNLRRDNIPVSPENIIRRPADARFYGKVRDDLQRRKSADDAPRHGTTGIDTDRGISDSAPDDGIGMNAPLNADSVTADNSDNAPNSTENSAAPAAAPHSDDAAPTGGGNGDSPRKEGAEDIMGRLPSAEPEEIVSSFEGIITRMVCHDDKKYIENMCACMDIITDDIEPGSATVKGIPSDFFNNVEGEICRHPAEFSRTLSEMRSVTFNVKRADPLTGEVFESKVMTLRNNADLSEKWYAEAVKKFGGASDMVNEYIRKRIEKGDSKGEAVARITAAARSFEIFAAIEKWAKDTTKRMLDEYGPGRNLVTEKNRSKWDTIEGNTLPYIERNLSISGISKRQNMDYDRYPKHIVASSDGWAYFKLNELEKKVVGTELAKGSTVAWYRNPSRSPSSGNCCASLSIPYCINGVWNNMYPDFIFFEKSWRGITRFIVDPHGDWLGDSIAKLKGYVEYVREYPDMFTSVLVVAEEEDGECRYLDLKVPSVQAAVEAFNGTSAKELFMGQYSRRYHIRG